MGRRIDNPGNEHDFNPGQLEEFTRELHDLMLKEVKQKDGTPISFTQRKLCIIEAIKRTYETMGG